MPDKFFLDSASQHLCLIQSERFLLWVHIHKIKKFKFLICQNSGKNSWVHFKLHLHAGCCRLRLMPAIIWTSVKVQESRYEGCLNFLFAPLLHGMIGELSGRISVLCSFFSPCRNDSKLHDSKLMEYSCPFFWPTKGKWELEEGPWSCVSNCSKSLLLYSLVSSACRIASRAHLGFGRRLRDQIGPFLNIFLPLKKTWVNNGKRNLVEWQVTAIKKFPFCCC